MELLRDRVAIVTGASSGIGRAVARRLAEEGASVLVTARRLDRLEALAEEMAASGGVALPVACDIADEAQIDHVVAATVERFGQSTHPERLPGMGRVRDRHQHRDSGRSDWILGAQ